MVLDEYGVKNGLTTEREIGFLQFWNYSFSSLQYLLAVYNSLAIVIFFSNVAGASSQLTVYHGYVASSYHTGIISGFTLISSYMENVASSGKMASISDF